MIFLHKSAEFGVLCGELKTMTWLFSIDTGIVVRTKENPESAEVVTHAPFLLLPSPVPKQCYCDGVSVQTDFNLLMHKVAHDYEFLRDALQQ